MKIIADLHLHSSYSRATSKNLTVENLEKYARIKGIDLLGTGDFTHPNWLKDLKSKLTEDGTGFLKTKTGFPFVLQAEVSNIYSQDNKLRRVHSIILAKDFFVVDQINELLSKKGKLASDGRPIFGKYSCMQLVEDMQSIDKNIEVIPAHIFTPWFSIFGSMSGFDSVEECFGDKAKHIHALETGISSDPAMNWRISKLDRFTLVSNSDSHSFWPWRMGREANLFDIKPDYDSLISALRTKRGMKGTIEVDPAYGKYHFDGHRACNICMNPSESLKKKNICPVCGRTLTIGVLHRVEQLADRPEGFKPKNPTPFYRIIPLHEIISLITGIGIASKKTWAEYNILLEKFGSELNILLQVPEEELKKITSERLTEAIMKNREGKIEVQPGYDGLYGIPILGAKSKTNIQKENIKQAEPKKKKGQLGLDGFI